MRGEGQRGVRDGRFTAVTYLVQGELQRGIRKGRSTVFKLIFALLLTQDKESVESVASESEDLGCV